MEQTSEKLIKEVPPPPRTGYSRFLNGERWVSINSPERVRAEAKYRKLQRASENANAGAEYQAERQQLQEKTSRLKSLRLAQAADRSAAADAATSTPERRAGETGESAHKFGVGDVVIFAAQPRTSAAQGQYEITGLLPPREQPQYRIKSVLEGHERVAQEDQLSAP